jgi:hypothetical protein
MKWGREHGCTKACTRTLEPTAVENASGVTAQWYDVLHTSGGMVQTMKSDSLQYKRTD